MGEIEGAAGDKSPGVLPPAPMPAAAYAGTERTGCFTAFLVMVLALVVLISLVIINGFRGDKASYRYRITDAKGSPLAFHATAGSEALMVVGVLCLGMAVFAVGANWGKARSRLACVGLLVLSAVAVGGGLSILRQPVVVSCAACLHPDIVFNSCETLSAPLGTNYNYDPAECPAAYRRGAEDAARAIDRQAIALVVIGGACGATAIGLLIRTMVGGRRARGDPEPTRAPPI